MRNVFKIVSSVGSAALLLSGAAMAAAPIPLNGWTINSAGTIAGAGCASTTVGAGFFQCQMVIGVGAAARTYVQTIIAEATTAFVTGGIAAIALNDLAFLSQDFVQIGAGSTPGLASNLRIVDTATNPGTSFVTSAGVDSGWSATAGFRSNVTLGLQLSTPGLPTENEGFSSDFRATINTTAGINPISQIASLMVGQTVDLGGPVVPLDDKQRFELRQGPANAVITNYRVGGGTTGPAVSAAVGNTLQGLWVGQAIAGLDNFASQRLTNLTVPGVLSTSSLTTLGSAPGVTRPVTVDWASAGQVFFDQFRPVPATPTTPAVPVPVF